MFGSVLKWGSGLLQKLGWGAAGLAGAAAVTTAATGPGGIVGDAVENISATLKNTDAVTDVDNFFTRMARGLQDLVKLFTNLPAILSGKVDYRTLFTDSNPSDVPSKGPIGEINKTIAPVVETTQKVASDTMNGIEGVIPDEWDGGDATKATLGTAVAAGAGLWGLNKLFGGGGKAAATAATGAADDIAKAAMKAPIPGWIKLLGAATIVGGGAVAANNLDQTPVVPGENGETPETITIMNPGGFIQDLGDGLSGILKPSEQSSFGYELDKDYILDGAANNGKAFAQGFNTAAGWTAGFAWDVVNFADDLFGIHGIENKETSYADQSAQFMKDSFNRAVTQEYDVFGMKFDLGGAPDMNDSWSQVFNFAGGAAFGGGVVKGASMAVNGSKVITGATGLTTSNANISTSAATGPIINGLTP